jgi:putative ABC transport system permease protein
MLRSYLAAALRHLARNQLYAWINIIGLAIGFAAAILITAFVWHERSFEHFLPGYENIYRLSAEVNLGRPGASSTDDLKGPIVEQLKLDFPQIRRVASLRNNFFTNSVRRGNVEAIEPGFWWADPDIFEVLPLSAAAGDLHTALERPDGLVLTRRMARKYFGSDLPLGQTIEIDREHTMRVTAVLEDLPSNTHLNAEIFASARALPPLPEGFVYRCYVYLRLAPGASAAALRAALPAFVDRHSPGQSGKASDTRGYSLIPIGDIHLRPTGRFAMKPGGDSRLLGAIAIVGLLVLLTAAINYINLMTARLSRRAVEVGVRKAAGGSRGDLTLQFLGESVMYCLIGMLFAVALAELLLPRLNSFLDRSIVFDYWRPPWLIGLFGLALIVGILAGIYPALVLSAFRPATVLKGVGPLVTGSGWLRQFFVVLQFAILIGLILATGVINLQTAFGLREGLRFDKDQLLSILVPLSTSCMGSAFTQRVAALPGVRGMACSMEFLVNYSTQQYRTADGREVALRNTYIGPGLFELLGLAPVAGRFFSRDRASDVMADIQERDTATIYHTVVNQTAARQLGFAEPAAAIGQIFTSITDARPGTRREIIGVVPDFAHDSVRVPIDPVFYDDGAPYGDQLNVKLRGTSVPETLQAIDQLWKEMAPLPAPIKRQFYDQYTQTLYRDLERQSALFSLFAAIALLLAGLGLFGLAAFTFERRTREIGIRKALGAATGDILLLLLWQFARPVLWANLITWPLAVWLMTRWLETFAYHIDLPLWLFPATGAATLTIALLTVSVHSTLVARTKPVAALHYE